jgi:hypothetical protein
MKNIVDANQRDKSAPAIGRELNKHTPSPQYTMYADRS